MREQGEKLSLKNRVLAVCLTGSLALTACHTHNTQNTNRDPVVTPASPDALIHKGLNDFKKKVTQLHEADFGMGWCVGWPTQGDKIIVTVNPGVEEIVDRGQHLIMFMFSHIIEQSLKPAQQILNGPFEYDNEGGDNSNTLPNAKLVTKQLDLKSSDYDRSISHELVRGDDERWSYVDIETNLPVLKSAVVDGPLDTARLARVCDEMQPGYAALPSVPQHQLPSKSPTLA